MTQDFQLQSLFEVVSVQSGQRFKVDEHGGTAMLSVAENVTSGGTLLLQTSANGTSWTTRKTRTITANGVFMDRYNVHPASVIWARCRLSARTDGTYTAYVVLHGGPSP